MTATDLFWSFANFIAPAFWLGLAMAAWGWLTSRLNTRTQLASRRWLRNLLLDWVIGTVVLLAGLVLTGHDGRMLTYAVLVLAIGARRWLSIKPPRKGA